jgi:cytochrome P450
LLLFWRLFFFLLFFGVCSGAQAGMVIHEALRMYPPAPLIMRQAAEKTKVGALVVPKKTMLFIPVVSIHHDPALWGADASEFNPERFAGGVGAAARAPSCFFPFSMGQRTCLGQHFTLLEAHAALASMLCRFRFSLSPGYRHAPVSVITIQPQYGMQIIVERL